MKIAIDTRMAWSSGVGTYIRNLVPALLAARPGDRFFLLGSRGDMERWPGFHKPNAVWVETSSKIYTFSEQWEVARRIPKDADLFWSPFYNVPLLWKGKLLATVHDVFHLAGAREISGFHRRLYASYMFGHLARRADSIICVSQFTKKELLTRVGGDALKMKVIHNGVDTNRFNIKKRKRPHPKPYLLYVGNVKPHKNLGRLLQAFALLKDRITHDLVVVGKKEGFLTGDRKSLEIAKGYGGRIHFTGPVDDVSLGQYYVFSEMLVFPSLYEGFGLPPLEAMASGIPVASSSAASLPEVCGEAVHYFDPFNPAEMAEKIVDVIQDGALRKKLIRKGFQRVEQFSWARSANETNRLIDDLLVPTRN